MADGNAIDLLNKVEWKHLGGDETAYDPKSFTIDMDEQLRTITLKTRVESPEGAVYKCSANLKEVADDWYEDREGRCVLTNGPSWSAKLEVWCRLLTLESGRRALVGVWFDYNDRDKCWAQWAWKVELP